MAKNSIITIDMGGTKMLGCAINSKDGIIARVKYATDPNSSNKEYINLLLKLVNNVLIESKIEKKNIKAVCLGVPGSVNPFSGVIGLAPNLGLENFNIKKPLEDKLKIPVLIENDVNLAALGIKKFEADKKVKNLLTVFVGTGIGGGLVFNNKLYRGTNYVAGEIGHILVQSGGPMCGCGNKGCFEAIASRTAIVKKITEDISNGKKSSLQKQIKSAERIKSKMLVKAIKTGDAVVINRVTDACKTIGEVLASLTNLLNFELIVLGGGLIEAAGDFMLPEIKISFNKHVLADSKKDLKILITKLGDDAAIFGGIPLLEEFQDVKV